MPIPKVSEDFTNHLLDLRDLEARQNSPEGQVAAQLELSTMNLYNIASTLGDEQNLASMGEIEKILRTGKYDALKARLGPAKAAQLRQNFTAAFQKSQNDKGIDRTLEEAATDVAVGVPASAINMLWAGEMLGGGAVLGSDYAGISAENNSEFNRNIIDPMLSDALKSKRQVAAAKDAISEREHAFQSEQAIARGADPIAEAISRVTLDTGSSALHLAQDPTLLSQGLSEAAASMGTTALLSKGFAKIGQAVVAKQAARLAGKAAAKGSTEEMIAEIGKAALKRFETVNAASWAAAAGVAEGTGAYQQTVMEVLARDAKDLAQSSEDFRNEVDTLVKQGVPQSEAETRAQRSIAHKAGLLSAAVSGVTGAALGHFLGEGGSEPVKIVNSYLKDVLGEGAEEGLQGLAGGLAQNVGIQKFVDPKQDLLQGVGGQIGQGALLGFASAGALKTPEGLLHGSKAIVKQASNVAEQRRAVEDTKSNTSVVSLENQSVSLNNDLNKDEILLNSSKGIEDTTKVSEADGFINKIRNSLTINELPSAHSALSEENQKLIKEGQSKVRAADNVARQLLREKDPEQQIALSLILNQIMDPVRNLQKDDSVELLKHDKEATGVVNEHKDILNNIEKLPAVRKALTKADQIFTQYLAKNPSINVDTPEGQNTAQVVANQAVISPGSGNLKNVEQVLMHAEKGRISLTQPQKAALQGSRALLKAQEALQARATLDSERARIAKLEKRHLTPQEQTGSQVTVSPDPKNLELGKYSARQHVDRIIESMASGNTEKAQQYMGEFSNFVQHMQNKLEALNKHFKSGDTSKNSGVPYQQLLPGGIFELSTTNPNDYAHKHAFVNPGSEASIKFAQEVGDETNLLQNVLENLHEEFPSLDVKIPERNELHPDLRGDPKDIVKSLKPKVESKPKSEPVQDKAPVQETKKEPKKAETVSDLINEALSDSDTKPKSEPVREEKTAQKPVQEAEKIQPKVEETKPETTKQAYPDSITDKLDDDFKIRLVDGEASTRTFGKKETLSIIRGILESKDSLKKTLDKQEASGELTPEIAKEYSDLLSDSNNGDEFTVGRIMALLDSHLAKFLKVKLSEKDSKTVQDALDKAPGTNTDPTTWKRGKLLNIVEKINDKYQFIQELKEMGAVAAIHWFLTVSGRQTPVRDEETVLEKASSDGIDESFTVSDKQLQNLAEGQSVLEVKQSLANVVRQFWGIQGKPTSLMGYTDGIPEAMASELIDVLVEMGLIKTIPVSVGDKTIDRYFFTNVTKDSVLKAYPSALEDAIVRDPEPVSFYEDKEVPLTKGQLSNKLIATTESQDIARTNMQKVKHYLNTPMVEWFRGLGERGAVELFGTPLPLTKEGFEDTQLSEKLYNKNDLKSIRGLNRSLTGAIEELERVVAEMENQALKSGKPSAEIAKKYQYAVNSVNRIMMQGAYNPQSSKIMREALMATWSTLDLSNKNGKNFQHFMLATAQAFGRKIHRFSLASNMNWVTEELNKYAPAIDVLAKWLKEKGNLPNQDLIAALPVGTERTPLLIQTLMEHARIKNASPEELKAFRTPQYLEADGMTNGPFNTMGLLSSDLFSEGDIAMLEKGGLSVGTEARTADTLTNGPKDDIYQAGAVATQGRINALINRVKNQVNGSELRKIANNLYFAMSILSPDVKLGDDGLPVLERGIVKNPMTVLVYGSGEAGVAGKVASNLIEEFYSLMSKAAKATAEGKKGIDLAQELFPKDKPLDALQKTEQLGKAIDVLTKNRVAFNLEEGKYEVRPNFKVKNAPMERLRNGNSTYSNFTFSSEELKGIEANILELFVKPFREAVEHDVLGSSAFRAGDLIRDTTNLMVSVAQNLLLKAVEGKVINGTEFISKADFDEIWNSLLPMMPFIKSDGQAIMVAKQKLFNTIAGTKKYQYSNSFADKRETGPNVKFVAKPKAAVPYVNIAMGDARMVREIFQELMDNSMQVFDGINIPIDQIENYGLRINEAALKAWRGNIFKSLEETFTKFSKDSRLKNVLNDIQAANKILFDLLPPKEKQNNKDNTAFKTNPNAGLELNQKIADLLAQVQKYSKDMEARQKALDEVQLSMDQMAGTYSPHVQKGHTFDENATPAEKAQWLNSRIEEHSQIAENKPKSAIQILKDADFYDAVSKMRDNAKTPGEHELINALLQGGGLDGVKIVIGSKSQIATYQQEVGATSLANLPTDREIHGFYSPSENTVYSINGSHETLLHELIHAATSRTIHAYYDGVKIHENEDVRVVVEGAVQRLDKLMNIFLKTDFKATSELGQSIANTVFEINNYLEQGNKAAALSEFVAWSQANKALAEKLADTGIRRDLYSRMAKVTRAVYNALVKLVWGKNPPTKFGQDVLSQVRFNTAIISRIQNHLSLEQVMNNSNLLHAVRRGYEDPNLDTIRETFSRMIARHLTVNYSPDWAKNMWQEPKLANVFIKSNELTQQAEAYFQMDAEEASTFQMIAASLATEAHVNPHALIEANKLYSRFVQGLSPSDFLTGHDVPEHDAARASEKYDFILGRTFRDAKGKFHTNDQNRTYLLPSFMALAITNPEFRNVLANKEVKKGKMQKIDGLDSLIENSGFGILRSLSNRLSGLTNTDTNMRDVVDHLTQNITRIAYNENAFLQAINLPGKATNAINDMMVNGFKKIGAAALTKGDELRTSKSTAVKAVGAALEGVAAIASEKEGAIVAERAVAALDKTEIPHVIRDLTNDLIGRTESSAPVWDMVSKVRGFIARSRQDYREKVPVIIKSKFSRKLTVDESDTKYRVLGRYDVASLVDGRATQDVLNMITDEKATQTEIEKLEKMLKIDSNWKAYNRKIDQYVNFVKTGIAGSNLLRNAYAIARLFGETRRLVEPSNITIKAIDQLITLRLLAKMDIQDRNRLTTLVQQEMPGMEFTLDYLKGQRNTELKKVTDPNSPAIYNHFKGAIPSDPLRRGRVIVADDASHTSLVEQGYVKLGKYKGSSLEAGSGNARSYYFTTDESRPAFMQGVAQNVQQTGYGVHLENGFSLDNNIERITDGVTVSYLAKKMNLETDGPENLQPIYNPTGVVIAFERSLDPAVKSGRVETRQDLAQVLGIWRGRQQEESWASKTNEIMVDRLAEIYLNDPEKDRYINVFDTEDPIIKDAVSIFPSQLRSLIASKFGGNAFYVRRSMLNYTIGYRNASVGDIWTGNSRLPKETREAVKNALIAIFKIDAYSKLVKVEKNLQALMLSARTNIVVRSIVVPFANTVSGIYQLMARGVPVTDLKNIPKKVLEIEAYTKSLIRKVEIEAELRANEDKPHMTKALQAELATLKDSWKNLSIWPLLEHGEFSSISDVGATADELGLTNENITDRMAKAVDKLPAGLRDLARQGYFARDTAIFQTLQKWVQYSDFIMKSVYFDHLMKKGNLLADEDTRQSHKKQVLAKVSEEFNNYDLPTGRMRSYVESVGLAWFLNFKLRSTKIGLRMIRENPFHVLMMSFMPAPASVGIPVGDNILAATFAGTMGYTIGPGMAFNPIALNPILNMMQ